MGGPPGATSDCRGVHASIQLYSDDPLGIVPGGELHLAARALTSGGAPWNKHGQCLNGGLNAFAESDDENGHHSFGMLVATRCFLAACLLLVEQVGKESKH